MIDIQNLIIELEYFRVYLPLHTRGESKVIVDKIIQAFIELQNENERLKESLDYWKDEGRK